LAVVRLVLIAAVLCWSALAPARDIARWRPYVAEASMRFGVPVDWIERVIDAESRGDPMLGGRPTVSPAGAMGLMQLMPGTWSDMRARLGLGADPHDPRNNILAGTLYMRLLFDRFGCPGLFAAYNAGPARYTAYLIRGRALPAETRGYLATVAGKKSGPNAIMRLPSHSGILFSPVGIDRGVEACRLPCLTGQGRHIRRLAVDLHAVAVLAHRKWQACRSQGDGKRPCTKAMGARDQTCNIVYRYEPPGSRR
jgi:hypothetical protein